MNFAVPVRVNQDIYGNGNSVIVHLNGNQNNVTLGRTNKDKLREAICMSGKTLRFEI